MAGTVSISTVTVPKVDDIERIAAIPDAVLRNLLITQCYCELSTSFSSRTGIAANWCTFATWASKQAGQTIRKEDLQRTLASLVEKDPLLSESMAVLGVIARQFGAGQNANGFQRPLLLKLLSKTADDAADAVGRGNKKVFEEIALQFTRFHELCFGDTIYHSEHIDAFNQGLKKGLPPDGQEYLRRAFTRYYQSFFEDDLKKRAELCFLANLEIGFHEQTRLQPEIAEALNAAFLNEVEIEKQLYDHLFSKSSLWTKIRLFFQRIFGRTDLLKNAIGSFTQLLKDLLRKVLTDHLMTLTFPPAKRLQLGKDLVAVYPDLLRELQHEELLSLLKEIDPTPNSLLQSGATDWANLQERMHYITDLFRCFYETKELFLEAFTKEQVADMKVGRIPTGVL
jgi:hypothetical protein